jgi:hypothetical protein
MFAVIEQHEEHELLLTNSCKSYSVSTMRLPEGNKVFLSLLVLEVLGQKNVAFPRIPNLFQTSIISQLK